MLDYLKVDLEHNQEHGFRQKHIAMYSTYREMFKKLNYRGRIENSANSVESKANAKAIPSQTPVRDVCVETDVQKLKSVIQSDTP